MRRLKLQSIFADHVAEANLPFVIRAPFRYSGTLPIIQLSNYPVPQSAFRAFLFGAGQGYRRGGGAPATPVNAALPALLGRAKGKAR